MKPIEPAKVERILIRATNWVGDAVMSIPAMREIRRIFSKSRISLLVRPWVRDVYSSVDFIDEVLTWDRHGIHRGWRGLRRMAVEIRNRDFQLAILFQNAIEAAVLAWLGGVPQRLGYARDLRGPLLTHPCKVTAEVQRVHQVFYYLDVLSQAGLLPKRLWESATFQYTIRIGVRASDGESAARLLEGKGVERGARIIGINPGATYGPAKRWLSERYAQVADALSRECQATIVLVGSPGEERIANEIARQMETRAVILAGHTSLGELMAVLQASLLLVTNDSGPMHLASALAVPLVAIFGSTSHTLTGPLGAQASVVHEPVECSPCFLRECPIDFRCMTRISVEQVVRKAKGLLEQQSGRK